MLASVLVLVLLVCLAVDWGHVRYMERVQRDEARVLPLFRLPVWWTVRSLSLELGYSQPQPHLYVVLDRLERDGRIVTHNADGCGQLFSAWKGKTHGTL